MEMQAGIVAFDPGVAAFMPVQWHGFAAQRQAGGLATNQCAGGIVRLMVRDLRGQPTAMLMQETFARYQAGAQRQCQSRAAFIHAQLQAFGARIAHALNIDGATIRQRYRDNIAFDAMRRPWGDQAAEQAGHGIRIA